MIYAGRLGMFFADHAEYRAYIAARYPRPAPPPDPERADPIIRAVSIWGAMAAAILQHAPAEWCQPQPSWYRKGA